MKKYKYNSGKSNITIIDIRVLRVFNSVRVEKNCFKNSHSCLVLESYIKKLFQSYSTKTLKIIPMANKTLLDVTNQLIESIDDLKNNKIDKETAAQIANSTQVVVNSAKVMLDFARLTGSKESIFFKEAPATPLLDKSYKCCKNCVTFGTCSTNVMKCKRTNLEFFEPK